jgi:hypothetical protein
MGRFRGGIALKRMNITCEMQCLQCAVERVTNSNSGPRAVVSVCKGWKRSWWLCGGADTPNTLPRSSTPLQHTAHAPESVH